MTTSGAKFDHMNGLTVLAVGGVGLSRPLTIEPEPVQDSDGRSQQRFNLEPFSRGPLAVYPSARRIQGQRDSLFHMYSCYRGGHNT